MIAQLFLGSEPDRGQSPVEWGDFPYVHLFVRWFVCRYPPLGHPARPVDQPARPEALGLRPGWLGLRPGWLGLRPGWMAQRGERKYS